MDWLTFISSMVSALAWPCTVLVVLVLLRKPLQNLLPLVQRFKYKELEVEFGKGVEELRAEIVSELPTAGKREALPASSEGPLAALAVVSPRAAVLEAWREVELAALEAARRLGGEAFRNKTLTFQAIRLLEQQDQLDRGVISLLRDLRGLRNQAAHAPDFALSTEAALGYAESAQAVAGYLRHVASGA